MTKEKRILILEDLPSDAELAKREIKNALKKVVFKVVDTKDDYIQSLEQFSPDLIISDYQLPSYDGMSALHFTKKDYPFIPFIILTGSMNEDTAVNCMKAGADDYVIKEHLKRLGSAAINAIKKKKTEKKAQQASLDLKKSEEKYRNLFYNMSNGLILGEMIYTQDNKPSDYKILMVNNAYEKQNDIKAIDIIGKKAKDIDPQIDQKLIETYAEIAEVQGQYEYEHFQESKSQYYKTTVFSFEKGKFVLIITNITESKLAENKIKEALDKAKESDKLKSAFLANMSHEIRTPMNGILGFASLLKEPNLDIEEQQQYISIIEKGGTRMLNIINEIIDISRIEAGLMDLSVSPININHQLEYLYDFFKPEVKTKGMQLSFYNSLKSSESIVNTDSEKLIAIFTNLIKNAIKYSDTGLIKFGYKQKGDFLECYVFDQGYGIPKERQDAIFERFIQADIEDIMARQGAGLGLSISKAYVEMLGGEIWIESDINQGSKFYFTIPFEKENSTIGNTEVQINESFTKNQNIKILIAEDDDDSYKYLSTLLEKLRCKIIHCKTGKEAVQLCQTIPNIDIILMDVKMPEMNGHDATRHIRKFNSDVYIVAQTAYALSEDRTKALESGCNDYISKPINKLMLNQMFNKYEKNKTF